MDVSSGLTLNLGCGLAPDLSDQTVNVDAIDLPGVNVVWDLDDTPWPWGDGAFAQVRAIQVFEHLTHPVAFMTEVWRVLEPGGVLELTTPHWQSDNAWTDPTHRRAYSTRTWDYWCPGTPLHTQFGYGFGDVLFDREIVELVEVPGGPDIHVRLRRVP